MTFDSAIANNKTTDAAVATTAESAAHDSVWAKLAREGQVLSTGLASGISKGFKESVHDPVGTGMRVVSTVGIGLALGCLTRGGGAGAWLSKGIGTGFGVGFAYDALSPERWGAVRDAMRNTWNSPDQTEASAQVISNKLGRFAFDAGFLTLAGVAAARLGAVHAAAGRQETPLNRKIDGVPAAYSEPATFRAGSRLPVGLRSTTAGALGGVDAAAVSTGRTGLPPVEVFSDLPLAAPKHGKPVPAGTENLPIEQHGLRDQVVWTREDGKTLVWEPSAGSIQARREAQSFVDAFMRRDYVGALKTAVGSKALYGVELNPEGHTHTLSITAAEMKEPDRLQFHLDRMNRVGKFNWEQSMVNFQMENQRLKVLLPKTVVPLEQGSTPVALVDFVRTEDGHYSVELPKTNVAGAPLTRPQIEEISSIRNSSQGQRLIAETALAAFEESIVHANQHVTVGGDIISPTYAAFTRDFGAKYGTRPHMLSFLGMLTNQSPVKEAFYEQEVPALLYDAGMPLEVIKRHYFRGASHVAERTPVINYLQTLEDSATTR